MAPGFPTRQSAYLALAANAVRPPRWAWASVPTFFSGWVTGELAPHLTAAILADDLQHLARRGIRTRSTAIGLGLSAAALVLLGLSIRTSIRSHTAITDALRESIGADEARALDAEIGDFDPSIPWRALRLPFLMRDPEVRVLRDIEYAPTGRRGRLDLYLPRGEVRDAPLLVQIHGGGWVIGDKSQQGLPLMLHLAANGWVCAAVNYPLTPRGRWPDHLVAVKRAIAWLRAHAEDYGIDPGFVAVTGGSAGGHLAAMTALTADDPSFQPGFEDADTSIAAAAPMYGVYDLAGTSGDKALVRRKPAMGALVFGRRGVSDEDLLAASPIGHLRADAPPMLIVHGDSDTLLPPGESADFANRLREVSEDVVGYAAIPGAQHAFDVFTSIRSSSVTRGVARFLIWTHRRYRRGRSTLVTADD